MRQSLKTVALCTVTLLACNPASARNQWDVNHGGTQQQAVDPRVLPGGQWSGYVKPPVGMDFWQGQLNRRIPSGSVLTAILEDDLHSAKNARGDTFALTLQDGFAVNGNQVIPPNSKIIGTVLNAVSATAQRSGHPGNIEISLQSLVFPDGRHMPIHAVIDSNPNHAFKKAPSFRNAGNSLKDYGSSVSAMALSFVSGPGFMQSRINRGNEFVLSRGDAIPVRLTRSIDVPEAPATGAPIIGQPSAGGMVGSAQLPFPPNTGATPGAVPGLIDPHGPFRIPGLVPGAPQQFNSQGAPQYVPQGVPQGAPQFAPQADPNAIFNQPITTPTLNDMPNPF